MFFSFKKKKKEQDLQANRKDGEGGREATKREKNSFVAANNLSAAARH